MNEIIRCVVAWLICFMLFGCGKTEVKQPATQATNPPVVLPQPPSTVGTIVVIPPPINLPPAPSN